MIPRVRSVGYSYSELLSVFCRMFWSAEGPDTLAVVSTAEDKSVIQARKGSIVAESDRSCPSRSNNLRASMDEIGIFISVSTFYQRICY